MKKKVVQVLVLALCFTIIMNSMILPVAFSKTIPVRNATFKCVTHGNQLFGRISRVTFKNTGKDNVLKINVSSNCTVYPKDATLYYNGSVVFTIKTSFGSVGKTFFYVKDIADNNKISYEISSSGTELIVWVD